jgi:integration host factor subunit alpha
MALKKIEIVKSVQNQTGFTKNRSLEIVEAVLEIIKDTLTSGEDVLISNFGKFCVKQKDERRGRKAITGKLFRKR